MAAAAAAATEDSGRSSSIGYSSSGGSSSALPGGQQFLLQACRQAVGARQLILESVHLSLKVMSHLSQIPKLFISFLLHLFLLHQFGQLHLYTHTWSVKTGTF